MATQDIEALRDFGKHLKIVELKAFPSHLQILYSLDNQLFLCKVLYPLHFLTLFECHVGLVAAHIIYAHIALIEGCKYMATFPSTYDVTTLKGLSQSSLDFFQLVVTKAWSQYHFENNVVYNGPRLIHGELTQPTPLVKHNKDNKQRPYLLSNGGGKDSWLCMHLFHSARIPFSVFQHARTEYGKLHYQHDLQKKIPQLFSHINFAASNQALAPSTYESASSDTSLPPGQFHPLTVFDDFTDGVLLQLLCPRLQGDSTRGNPTQVGWPEMVFESLPFIMTYDYAAFVLGNERSADTDQGEWGTNGENKFNHQWLKSFEACSALDKLISAYIPSFRVFSALKPIYDYRIYRALAPHPSILPHVHSCNLIKPWCKRCSKCAYVFLNFIAVFGWQPVFDVFQENLFDVQPLQLEWRHLMGLEAHNALECVGEVDETRLAFKRCCELGCKGAAIDVFKASFDWRENGEGRHVDWKQLLNKFDRVYEENHGIPDEVFQKIKHFM